MRIVRVLATTVTLATFIGGIPAAQASTPVAKKPAPTFTKAKVEGRKAVRAAMQQTNATSVSLALVANGKRVWSQTFGRVNSKGEKPSPTTKYGIGSVSKTLTAISIMQLVDAGTVSLDAPVVRYVPDFTMKSPQYRQITVRMLLNHSAGLPGSDYADALSYQPIPGYIERFLAGLRTSYLKTTPGAMNVYCNDCYTLAGLVVERVSGMTLSEYMAKNILKPLGMKHSTFPTSLPMPGKVAPVIQQGKALPLQVLNMFATGGLFSTPNDMARLAMVFTGGGVVDGKRILSRSAIETMGTDQTSTTLRVASPSAFRYGLGWDSMKDPALNSAGVRGWTKGGDLTDFHAGFLIAPDQGLAVIVTGAGKTFSSTSAQTIGQIVLLNALVDSGDIKLPPQISGQPAVATASAKQVNRVTGTYLAQGVTVRVTEGKQNSLRLQLLSNGKWAPQPGRLVRRADGAFWSTATPGSSITVEKAWGRTYLTLRGIGGTGTFRTHSILGQRVRSVGATPPAWQARVGQRWLLASEDPSSANWTLSGTPAVELKSIPGLSGYLLATGALVESVPVDVTASDTVASMFLAIPLVPGRDQYDLDFSQRGGEEYLTFSSSVLRPAATVPALRDGSHAVPIGPSGLVEWFRVPASATVDISGQSNWKMFNEDLSLIDSGGGGQAWKLAPAGAYLAVFGPAGSVATVVVG
ncbi:MAG: serine hydrolase domain-containing protein [Candidatus Nanopelagicales bacterium]